MTLSRIDLDSANQHWAVASVPLADRERAFEIAKLKNVKAAIGSQIKINYDFSDGDAELIRRVAVAFEIAAIEGLDSLIHVSSSTDAARISTQACAYNAFELLRSLDPDENKDARIYQVLHLGALAYCSDRSSDLNRWVNENLYTEDLSIEGVNAWNVQMLHSIYSCWMRLFRKKGWEDLSSISSIISDLRQQQKNYEDIYFDSVIDISAKRSGAFSLIALYNLARATESLALFMLQGEPKSIGSNLDQNFEASRKAAISSHDYELEVIVRWLHVAAKRMASASIWWVTQNSPKNVWDFTSILTKSRGMFELLPPQRVAIRDEGLLDPAHRAIVVDMPTSGGKTALAQFRMLQALNQFQEKNGWIAYVAPTKALVTQISRRLRRDFTPLGIRVEHLTGAVEIDSFEQDILSDLSLQAVKIIVSTPEKLNLVIKNKKIDRPLSLVVMDEAHNMEDEDRGLRIELLLAVIKRDCPSSNFLLLMPYVPNAVELADWLAPEAGKAISLSGTAWKPNDRIIGYFAVEKNETSRGAWGLEYQTLFTTPGTIQLVGRHKVGDLKPFDIPFSQARTRYKSTAAIAKLFAARGTSIAVGRTIEDCWTMARMISKDLPIISEIPNEISLVQRFLRDEVSLDFELIDMLSKGVAVHHAGLSDETRTLIEWLTEEGYIKVLCATSTIHQGLNFPVASVFLSSLSVPYGRMTHRAFWNLAGRAGRIGHESVGVVGIASDNDEAVITEFVSKATGNLISRLVEMLDDVEKLGQLSELSSLIYQDQWSDFRGYIAHLWAEKQNLDEVLAESEQILRNTFGYFKLKSSLDIAQSNKAEALLAATRQYAQSLSENPKHALLADATGFSPEGVAKALSSIYKLENKLDAESFTPEGLFGQHGHRTLSSLIGVMMRVPQISDSLNHLTNSGESSGKLADLANAWVNGRTIKEIAQQFFSSNGNVTTKELTETCKAIYKALSNSLTWGISAVTKLSGVDFESLSQEQLRVINNLPAMMYHGVKTEPAVLMRMNSVPRSIAEKLGHRYSEMSMSTGESMNVSTARAFLQSLNTSVWSECRPLQSSMSGGDYQALWAKLAGVEA